jgi:hypothetical protein
MNNLTKTELLKIISKMKKSELVKIINNKNNKDINNQNGGDILHINPSKLNISKTNILSKNKTNNKIYSKNAIREPIVFNESKIKNKNKINVMANNSLYNNDEE